METVKYTYTYHTEKAVIKSRTPTPGIRPVNSVVLDTNGRSVDRLLIKNVENFYFLFDGFPYVIAPVFSIPAFSIRAIYSCFSTPAFSAPPVIDLTSMHCSSMHDDIKQHATPIINVCASATVALSWASLLRATSAD